jgi:hemerythrin
MAIDNGIIDHDHQVLISIISDFIELKPYAGGNTELQRTMARLYHYANTHFVREEALQKASGFPACAEHEQQHRQLNERLDAISRQMIELIENAGYVTRTPLSDDLELVDISKAQHLTDVHAALSSLLRNWILGHILKTDLPMRQHVAAMKPLAVRMPSLWSAKPAQLAPAIDTPDAAKQALANAKGWMNARFHNDGEPVKAAQNEAPPSETNEHPAITRMRHEAQVLGMNAQFDVRCANFSSTALSQVYQLVSRTKNGNTGPQGFDLSPSDARPYLRQTALFQRTIDALGRHHYQATHVGTKFARIFGDIANRPLELVATPQKHARWKMLIDGALDFNAPLRVVSIAEAFGRNDLAIERLLVPFRSVNRQRDDVMIVASYDIALD